MLLNCQNLKCLLTLNNIIQIISESNLYLNVVDKKNILYKFYCSIVVVIFIAN